MNFQRIVVSAITTCGESTDIQILSVSRVPTTGGNVTIIGTHCPCCCLTGLQKKAEKNKEMNFETSDLVQNSLLKLRKSSVFQKLSHEKDFSFLNPF